MPAIAATPRIAAGNAYWRQFMGARAYSSGTTMKLLPLLLLPAACWAAACGGSDEPPRPPGPNEIVMTEYEFDPRDATVRRGRS